MKTKPEFKLKIKLSDSAVSSLSDEDKKDVKSLTVSIEATHSGIINGNYWFYTPAGMRDGVGSFTNPPAPVLTNHDPYSDPIGRVQSASYVSYGLQDTSGISEEIMDAKELRPSIKSFVDSDTFKDKEYKGLGHIQIVASITDEDAIEKLLDGRYLTVSISGNTDQAVCSICGMDMKNAEEAEKCPHYRGEMYDGELAYLIAGSMTFKEVSFVNVPADKNAKVQSISDGVIDIFDDDLPVHELEIIDFELKSTGANMKTKLSDLRDSKTLKADMDNVLVELGLGNHVIADEELEGLRKTSFLFSDERSMPVHTGAYVLAAKKLLETVEDSDEKTEILTVLDRRFKKFFGAKSLEDAINELRDENTEDTNAENNTTVNVEIDYDKLADAVVEKLKSVVSLDDSFLARRNEVLEDEIASLEQENRSLVASLKDTIIYQIMTIEDRVNDEKYKDKLSKRSLDSLRDKLADLSEEQDGGDNEPSGTDVSDSDNRDDNDNGSLQDDGSNISPEDASSGNGSVEDQDNGDKGSKSGDQDPQVLTISEVRDNYSRIIREKGLRAASQYIKELRDSKKLPANFTF